MIEGQKIIGNIRWIKKILYRPFWLTLIFLVLLLVIALVSLLMTSWRSINRTEPIHQHLAVIEDLQLYNYQLTTLYHRIQAGELVPAIINEYNLKAAKQVKQIPQACWDLLEAHHWPGNVRELRNVLERCVLFAEDEMLPLQWLQLDPILIEKNQLNSDTLCIPMDGSMDLDTMESFIIKSVLQRCKNSVTVSRNMASLLPNNAIYSFCIFVFAKYFFMS